MGDQKNLFLAIGISIIIIVIFQLIFPQQMPINQPKNNEVSEVQTSSSDTSNEIDDAKTIISKNEILLEDERILINNDYLSGSINLTGAILDDLILLKYKESLESESKNINLFYPDGTENPYFVEFEWKSKGKIDTELPSNKTKWSTNNTELSPNNPVTLHWVNKDNIVFKIIFEIDENYMFDITQIIENKTNKSLNIFPRRTIKRINMPDTIDFFILHEGLISVVDEKLKEKKYKKLLKECSDNSNSKDPDCDIFNQNGWLGFTDKYWMSTLIPDQNKNFNSVFKHYNKGRDIFVARYFEDSGNIINPNSNHKFEGKLFAGSKNLNILNEYENTFKIQRFTDAIDWGYFSFLTKPISYAINWFYGYAGNFGLAIIAFTILMRLILFPLAQASFKSMAKMKKLQPEMQSLKETYPNDRQKMQQELMALYKREGANPVAGCLPIFVQIPIFFSLYKVLFVTIEMYHAPFYGWIHDLSAPDPMGILILFGLIDWNVPAFLSIVNIGILPIFMGFTMWLQQKLNPAPTDPMQAKIFAILPFVFTFILAGFAAGLVLYWSVNNILSIAQQWVIQRKILANKDA